MSNTMARAAARTPTVTATVTTVRAGSIGPAVRVAMTDPLVPLLVLAESEPELLDEPRCYCASFFLDSMKRTVKNQIV
jgi:hypothetical protein